MWNPEIIRSVRGALHKTAINAVAASPQGSFFLGRNPTGYPAAHALARYRCFLADLAGLAGLRRAGPGIFNSNILFSLLLLPVTFGHRRVDCALLPSEIQGQ